MSGDDLPHDQPVLDKLPNVLAYNAHRFIIKFCNRREKVKSNFDTAIAEHTSCGEEVSSAEVHEIRQLVIYCVGSVDLRELARATSFASLGSIQTRFLPHLSTEAASLFCSLKNAIIYIL